MSSTWTPHRPERSWNKFDGGRTFRVASDYEPAGDQPQRDRRSRAGVNDAEMDQVLLGVTGSGKTFTMAKVIEAVQRPALILAHNKTLAAQLYGEFKSFFPDNAVEYFVSYYDYYMPEAYVPRTDTYIEKESSINEAIDRMRHSATRAILERDDVIIVASVSCIYGIGSVETYTAMTFELIGGADAQPADVAADLVALQYKRNDQAFGRGTFRMKGDTLDVWPTHQEDRAWKISFFGDEVESIVEFDPLTGKMSQPLGRIKVYANSHYVTPRPTLNQAVDSIKEELRARLNQLTQQGKLLEAQRLEQRTQFDMEMMAATGIVRRHRELQPLSHRPQTWRAAADAVRIPAGKRHHLRRRKPPDHPAARRDVPGRLQPQIHAVRIRLPPAELPRQPAAEIRRVGEDAAADHPRLGDARPVGAEPDRRRLHRTDHPPHPPDRSAGRGAPRVPRRRQPG